MIEIKKELSRAELRVMGLLLGLFFGLIGGLVHWRTEAHTVAYVLWAVGAVLVVLYYPVPGLPRPLYQGWMFAVFPLGWTVSHVILGVLYYLVITPGGLVMRLFGRDPMRLRLDPEAKTYWIERSAEGKSSYFSQF